MSKIETNQNSLRYAVTSRVRGTISRHRSISAAAKSLARDRRFYLRIGGYSDCQIYDMQENRMIPTF